MSLDETIVSGTLSTSNRDSTFFKPDWETTVKKTMLRASPFMYMMGKLGVEYGNAMTFNWSEQALQDNSVNILDVYWDAALSSAYASGGVAGDTLFLSMTAANAKKLSVNDSLSIFTSDTQNIRSGLVLSVNVVNDTTSYAAIQLLQADTSNRLAEATPSALISNAQPEFRSLSTPKYSELTQRTNYMQIMNRGKDSSDIQESTAEWVTPDAEARAMEQLLYRHRQHVAFSMLTGYGGVFTGGSLGTIWKTTGLMPWMDAYWPENVFDYKNDTDPMFAGLTSEQGLLDYFLKIGKITSLTSEADRKTVVGGSNMFYYLQRALKAAGNYQLMEGTNEFGIKVRTLHNMAGRSWDFVEDGTFSQYSMLQNVMVVYEPQLLRKRVFKNNKLNGNLRMVENETGTHSHKKKGYEEICGLRVTGNLGAIAIIKNIDQTNVN